MLEVTFDLISLIPLFPLLGAAYCFAMRGKKPSILCSAAASLMVLLSFLATLSSVFALSSFAAQADRHALVSELFTWIKTGGVDISASLIFDQLTAIMLLVITFVGFLIHIYSIGYMFHDEDFNRYFSYLNLFVFFMIVLVMAKNIPLMFVGWEGVGLCSYLLISFWWNDIEKARAGKKAFITNRVGDFAFLSGALILYWLFVSSGLPATFDFPIMAEITGKIKNFDFASVKALDFVCILFFIGAAGKSAQFPLYVWLPDAMAGPTPVSALIHAATMVTAGVYMCVRMSFLFTLSPLAMSVIAATGVFTAIFAALIAMAQTDIKKILAYSTVSQLGLMFTAVGSGAFAAAIFHLATHAFFKSLLFLGSGSVIHAMNGEQEIMKMGGLREKIPHTFRTFFIGTYAIAGLPLMSGFFSKDEILLYSLFGKNGNVVFYIIASLASLLTAVYMHRLLFLVFFGEFRGDKKTFEQIHESPAVMTVPLYALSFFSVFAGFTALSKTLNFENLLEGVTRYAPAAKELSRAQRYSTMGLATLLAFAGVFIAYKFYMQKNGLLKMVSKTCAPVIGLQKNKFFIDEIYEAVILKPLYSMSVTLHKYFDAAFIDNCIVNGTARVFGEFNRILSHIQSGNIQSYLSAMVLGLSVFLIYILFYAR
ncbi:MAG TPA: NADH-quinone oxidoreductase subunit L [Candidatus Wallbacteria bacterium]|nr:NADH-quinone oxidoreductase subunit L [Candidatus Wallbacteria bacterium]